MIANCACPHCGQKIEFELEDSGSVVPCPTCEKEFTFAVPAVAQPVAVKPQMPNEPTPTELKVGAKLTIRSRMMNCVFKGTTDGYHIDVWIPGEEETSVHVDDLLFGWMCIGIHTGRFSDDAKMAMKIAKQSTVGNAESIITKLAQVRRFIPDAHLIACGFVFNASTNQWER
jgi:hypothetical protein